MKSFLVFLLRLKQQCQAATGVEYALMAAGISLTIIFAVFAFGEDIQITFTNMFEVMSSYLNPT